MKIEVTIKRPLLGGEIEQQTNTGMLNATALVKIENEKRHEVNAYPFNLSQYLRTKSTNALIEDLESSNESVVEKSKQGKSKTWVHPLLFLNILLAIDPNFKVENCEWLFDEVLKYRSEASSNRTKMIGILFEKSSKKSKFWLIMGGIDEQISLECNVENWSQATSEQIFLRDKMYENITLLCSVVSDIKTCVRTGIKQAKENSKHIIIKR